MVSAFVDVWTTVTHFITQTFGHVLKIFYDPTSGLTFVGTMATIMSAIAIILLIFNLIRSFFPMHG